MRAAFRERMRQKIAVVREKQRSTALESRIAGDSVASCLTPLSALWYQTPVSFGVQMTMYEPFLEPDRFECSSGYFGNHRFYVRRAESAEASLRFRIHVGVPGLSGALLWIRYKQAFR